MIIQDLKITGTRGIIKFGKAVISGIPVVFSYNPKIDKFTSICYDKHIASGIFPEGISRDQPQEYLVGSAIANYIKNQL